MCTPHACNPLSPLQVSSGDSRCAPRTMFNTGCWCNKVGVIILNLIWYVRLSALLLRLLYCTLFVLFVCALPCWLVALPLLSACACFAFAAVAADVCRYCCAALCLVPVFLFGRAVRFQGLVLGNFRATMFFYALHAVFAFLLLS